MSFSPYPQRFPPPSRLSEPEFYHLCNCDPFCFVAVRRFAAKFPESPYPPMFAIFRFTLVESPSSVFGGNLFAGPQTLELGLFSALF